MKNNPIILLIFVFAFSGILLGQTTGKISGNVIDAKSGEPLIGTNIMIVGANTGAAADPNGYFYIINVHPGTYNIRATMIGYIPITIENVRVSVNRTSSLKIEMTPSVIQGQEVIVQADKIAVKGDQTSSVRNVSAKSISELPIETLDEVVNMQVGVVDGHFRGGRNTEVSYMIDGLQVDESFGGSSKAITLETESVEDMEIITGTFNAEYGRAMSGIVNAITKDGSAKFHSSASFSFSNYLSSNDDIFPGLGSELGLNMTKDFKIHLEGPIWKDKFTFFANAKYKERNGHLNGIRKFLPNDYNDYSNSDSSQWHLEKSGDDSYVSMSNAKNLSLFSKIVFKPIGKIKISGFFTLNDNENKNYSHYWKYNPDGLGQSYHNSYMTAISLNHMLLNSLFYELKFSHLKNAYQSYKYEDPTDARYLHPRYRGLGYAGFVTGGMVSPGKSDDLFTDNTIKFDLNWQTSSHQSIKTGFQYISHVIDKNPVSVINKYSGTPEEYISEWDSETGKILWPYYDLELMQVTDKTIGVYTVKPWEFSGYIQDKIEYESMVINLGLRYDYFNAEQTYPTNRRNPDNELLLPDSMMTDYASAPAHTQLSPRFGLAYKLGNKALLRFSYGHFFQMPPMYSLYSNNIFRVPLNDYGTTMGNALLFPQKTVQYEIGLWQEVMDGLGFEVALYYRDIYDLLSTKIVSTYNQIEYGLYTNKDYGNARGLEIKLDYNYNGFYSNLNYTLSYTKGNADNPSQTFTRAGSSMDPIKKFIPMSWDQRHTFNLTVGYSRQNYGSTLTGFYNSGKPYSFSPLLESSLYNVNLYMNNDYMPSGYKIDYTGFYRFTIYGKHKAKISLSIYNLLDRLNSVWVYGDTGQPYTTIIRNGSIQAHHSDFNEYEDRIENPTAYSTPREIKLSFGIEF